MSRYDEVTQTLRDPNQHPICGNKYAHPSLVFTQVVLKKLFTKIVVKQHIPKYMKIVESLVDTFIPVDYSIVSKLLGRC